MLERKMRLPKIASCMAVVCVHTQTGIGFILTAFYQSGVLIYMHHPEKWLNLDFSMGLCILIALVKDSGSGNPWMNLKETLKQMVLGTVLPAMGTKIATAMTVFTRLFIMIAERAF